jgi:hypothetical protein
MVLPLLPATPAVQWPWSFGDVWWTMALAGGRVLVFCFGFFKIVMAATISWSQNKIISASSILTLLVPLVSAKVAWSYVSRVYPEIQSVLVFVCVFLSVVIPIYVLIFHDGCCGLSTTTSCLSTTTSSTTTSFVWLRRWRGEDGGTLLGSC